MKIKLIKKVKQHKAGTVLDIRADVAVDLIKRGDAENAEESTVPGLVGNPEDTASVTGEGGENDNVKSQDDLDESKLKALVDSEKAKKEGGDAENAGEKEEKKGPAKTKEEKANPAKK